MHLGCRRFCDVTLRYFGEPVEDLRLIVFGLAIVFRTFTNSEDEIANRVRESREVCLNRHDTNVTILNCPPECVVST